MTRLRRWRTALRLARRELRRHPRSGVLVAALVALPSAAVMLVSVVMASQVPTADERIAAELGSSEAVVVVADPTGATVEQSPVDAWTWQYPGGAWPNDGMAEGADLSTAADIEAMLPADARIIRMSTGEGVLEADGAFARATMVSGGSWDEALTGPYQLLSGRAPVTANEALISPALADTLDLGLGDTVTHQDSGTRLTVVGTMHSRATGEQAAIFAEHGTLTIESGLMNSQWYVLDAPMTWEDVQSFNGNGLTALSRTIVLDPPATPVWLEWQDQNSPVDGALLATGGVGVLAVMLLAGAGFVVTFRAQQREHALVAVTGATRSTLVTLGAARGVWLGLAGGVAGVALGMGLGLGWVYVLLNWAGPDNAASTWGYHVIWWHVLMVIAYGAAAGMLASLVPALTASKIDAVSVLRGSQRPARVRRWPGMIGVLLLAAGAATMARAGTMLDASLDVAGPESWELNTQAWWYLAGGALLAFVGSTLLVAPALRLLARAVAGATVGMRIAMRDASRNVGRTVPVVAAVAIVVALAGAVLLTSERDSTRDAAGWQPSMPIGDAMVHLTGDDGDAESFAGPASEAIVTTVPGATVTVIERWRQDVGYLQAPMATPYLMVPEDQRCPIVDIDAERMSQRALAADPRCYGQAGNISDAIGDAIVGDADTLAAIIHAEPSDTSRATLDAGGVVVLLSTLLDGDTITVGLFDYAAENYPGYGEDPADSIVLPASYQPSDYVSASTLAVMSADAAAGIGWPTTPSLLLIDAPEPITPAQQADLDGAIARVTGAQVWTWVERQPSFGVTPVVGWATLGIVALFTIACTAIALGLARADARRDDFTLASLGAAPGLTRAVAACQSAVIVGLATTIGLILALGWVAADSRSFVDYAFAPTWGLIAAAWIGLPAAAGSLTWVFTRVPEPLHYRLAA